METVKIYTDGGCRGNGKANNIGAWGAILLFGDNRKDISCFKRNTTNNQMELQGAIEGLKAMKRHDLPTELYCDSAYVVNGLNQWVIGWERNGWRKKDGNVPENVEQWKELLALSRLFTDLKIIKVKGHAGNQYNEEVDRLVNQEMDLAN